MDFLSIIRRVVFSVFYHTLLNNTIHSYLFTSSHFSVRLGDYGAERPVHRNLFTRYGGDCSYFFRYRYLSWYIDSPYPSRIVSTEPDLMTPVTPENILVLSST